MVTWYLNKNYFFKPFTLNYTVHIYKQGVKKANIASFYSLKNGQYSAE